MVLQLLMEDVTKILLSLVAELFDKYCYCICVTLFYAFVYLAHFKLVEYLSTSVFTTLAGKTFVYEL